MTSQTFFFVFIPILAVILLAINFIFASHNPYQEKDSVFECGFHSFLGQNRTEFTISFFIFALLFLLFDLEILLVYPYIVSHYNNGIFGLIIVLAFMSVLTLGFVFEIGKNALSIESKQNKTTNLKKEEFGFYKSPTLKHWEKPLVPTTMKKLSIQLRLLSTNYIQVRNFTSRSKTGFSKRKHKKKLSIKQELALQIKKYRALLKIYYKYLVLYIPKIEKLLICLVYPLFSILAYYVYNINNSTYCTALFSGSFLSMLLLWLVVINTEISSTPLLKRLLYLFTNNKVMFLILLISFRAILWIFMYIFNLGLLIEQPDNNTRVLLSVYNIISCLLPTLYTFHFIREIAKYFSRIRTGSRKRGYKYKYMNENPNFSPMAMECSVFSLLFITVGSYVAIYITIPLCMPLFIQLYKAIVINIKVQCFTLFFSIFHYKSMQFIRIPNSFLFTSRKATLFTHGLSPRHYCIDNMKKVLSIIDNRIRSKIINTMPSTSAMIIHRARYAFIMQKYNNKALTHKLLYGLTNKDISNLNFFLKHLPLSSKEMLLHTIKSLSSLYKQNIMLYYNSLPTTNKYNFIINLIHKVLASSNKGGSKQLLITENKINNLSLCNSLEKSYSIGKEKDNKELWSLDKNSYFNSIVNNHRSLSVFMVTRDDSYPNIYSSIGGNSDPSSNNLPIENENFLTSFNSYDSTYTPYHYDNLEPILTTTDTTVNPNLNYGTPTYPYVNAGTTVNPNINTYLSNFQNINTNNSNFPNINTDISYYQNVNTDSSLNQDINTGASYFPYVNTGSTVNANINTYLSNYQNINTHSSLSQDINTNITVNPNINTETSVNLNTNIVNLDDEEAGIPEHLRDIFINHRVLTCVKDNASTLEELEHRDTTRYCKLGIKKIRDEICNKGIQSTLDKIVHQMSLKNITCKELFNKVTIDDNNIVQLDKHKLDLTKPNSNSSVYQLAITLAKLISVEIISKDVHLSFGNNRFEKLSFKNWRVKVNDIWPSLSDDNKILFQECVSKNRSYYGPIRARETAIIDLQGNLASPQVGFTMVNNINKYGLYKAYSNEIEENKGKLKQPKSLSLPRLENNNYHPEHPCTLEDWWCSEGISRLRDIAIVNDIEFNTLKSRLFLAGIKCKHLVKKPDIINGSLDTKNGKLDLSIIHTDDRITPLATKLANLCTNVVKDRYPNVHMNNGFFSKINPSSQKVVFSEISKDLTDSDINLLIECIKVNPTYFNQIHVIQDTISPESMILSDKAGYTVINYINKFGKDKQVTLRSVFKRNAAKRAREEAFPGTSGESSTSRKKKK